MTDLVYLYLLAPLHTGGTTQEGNLLGIARESHTNLPYIPSSTIRGRLRASVGTSVENRIKRVQLFGPDLKDTQDSEFIEYYEMETDKRLTQLEQGNVWVGDGSILWVPVPSLSHGVVWVSSPLLLKRWARFNSAVANKIPAPYSTSLQTNAPVYLKDAILKQGDLKAWSDWKSFVPQNSDAVAIDKVLVLPDQHCATLIQMCLWRQVKVKLDEHKSVEGGFRYEEAIPPDALMYFPWGITSQANGSSQKARNDFAQLLAGHEILQIGGQESLGRGFVQQWLAK